MSFYGPLATEAALITNSSPESVQLTFYDNGTQEFNFATISNSALITGPKTMAATVDRLIDVEPTAIQLTAEITAPGQTVTVNKYFANAHSIDWGDETPITNLTSTTLHTYTSPGTYRITLALTGGADRWTFDGSYTLVPK